MKPLEPGGTLVKVMMTLAGLSYGDPADLVEYLRNDTLTRGDWIPTWIAQSSDDPITFAFLAWSRSTGRHVLAIRGTYPDPFGRAYWDDGNLDVPFGRMREWPGSRIPGARVSQGAWTAFQYLMALTNGYTTLEQELRRLPRDTELYVTGHSLGGTLAPMVALWLSEQDSRVAATVLAFAGMTPGNRQFARLFDAGSCLSGRVWRYNNTLDTVGYGWDRVWKTRNFYAPGPRGGWLVTLLLALTSIRLIPYGFASFGQEIVIPGKLLGTAVDRGLIAYVLENLSQHLPGTYLALLGAPPLPFAMDFVSLMSATPTGTPAQQATRGPRRVRTLCAIRRDAGAQIDYLSEPQAQNRRAADQPRSAAPDQRFTLVETTAGGK